MKSACKFPLLFRFHLPLRILICIFTCFGFNTVSLAQLEGRFWYFGNNAGLDFNTNPPTALTNGALTAHEGSSCISDPEGNLLFYTNGTTVYNRLHQIMQNGENLGGHASSSQSSLIVPSVADSTKFYIFTTDLEGQDGGLQYNVVDISANAGLGAITVKNVLMRSPVCEKLTIVPHANGVDLWIIAQDYLTDYWVSYLITNQGVNLMPVVSPISSGSSPIGIVKVAPNYKYLSTSFTDLDYFEIMRFDNKTGLISIPLQITSLNGLRYPYGVEFSPNGKLLYISYVGFLAQYDVTNYDSNAVRNSESIVAKGNVKNLQMGIDKRIYAASYTARSVSYIDSPDNRGPACQFVSAGVSLQGRRCNLGLPNFPVFNILGFQNPVFNECINTSFVLIVPNVLGADSITWYIPKSLPSTDTITYSERQPTLTFSVAGLYGFRGIYYNNGIPQSVYGQIQIDSLPSINLGPDIDFCQGDSATVFALASNPDSIKWSTGATTSFIKVKSAGTYTATVYKNGCTNSDTIVVTTSPSNIQSFQPIVLCPGNSYTLTLPISDSFSYLWADGYIGSTRTFTDSGQYLVQSISNYPCYSWIDTIHVSILPSQPYPSELQFTPTFQCITKSMTLQASNLPGALISWDNGPFTSSTSHQLSLSTSREVPIAIAYPCDTFQFSYFIPARDSLCSCPYFIANAFHPESAIEGNKRFAVNLACTPTDFQLHIYNRWGQHIFSTTNPFEAWDGTTSSGFTCPEGVYLYQTQFLKPDGIWARESGTVHLIR